MCQQLLWRKECFGTWTPVSHAWRLFFVVVVVSVVVDVVAVVVVVFAVVVVVVADAQVQ